MRLSLNLPAVILTFSLRRVPPLKFAPLNVEIPAVTLIPCAVTLTPFPAVTTPTESIFVTSSLVNVPPIVTLPLKYAFVPVKTPTVVTPTKILGVPLSPVALPVTLPVTPPVTAPVKAPTNPLLEVVTPVTLTPTGNKGEAVPAPVSYTHLTLPTTPYV